eukprot:5738471-Amphidinium_carterae.1
MGYRSFRSWGYRHGYHNLGPFHGIEVAWARQLLVVPWELPEVWERLGGPQPWGTADALMGCWGTTGGGGGGGGGGDVTPGPCE